jgi:hypothetical protein
MSLVGRARAGREARRRVDAAARRAPAAYRPYDLVKEATIAFGVVLALTLLLAIVFSSPDLPPSTIKQWARASPVDFVTTATTELDGSSGTAGYGPPYNNSSTGQTLGFVHLQQWLGVSHPIDTARDFVLAPLRSMMSRLGLQRAISAYEAAPAATQAAWTKAYEKALGSATVGPAGSLVVARGSYGPVSTMMSSLLAFARTGGLDGALLTNKQFYQTDYTKPLLFLADGGSLASRAQSEHLLGNQWGIMNETGSYPGQVWLWLYTFWYQIKPFSTSANADVLVMAVMGLLSTGFVLVPFLPGVRDIPRRIPVHRLIWRQHYSAT